MAVKRISPGSTSVEQTKAEGEIKIKVIVLSIIGGMLALLMLLGALILWWRPEFFDTYIGRVLPIISAAVFGFIGFVVGQKVGVSDV